MPEFEVFKRQILAPSDDPAVTIQKRGVITVNKAAHLALGEPHWIELLYDPAERLVGFRSAPPDASHAYAFQSTREGKGPFVASCAAFIKHYNINTDRTRRWPARMHDDILVIDLKEAGVEVTSNRGKTKPAKPRKK
jgi:hypothetical protein